MEVGGGWGKFLEDKPHPDSILLAQKYVRERLEKKHLPLFLLSKDFQARQSPRLSMADSAEDVMVQKKRRSQAVLKVNLRNQEDSFVKLQQKLKPPDISHLTPHPPDPAMSRRRSLSVKRNSSYNRDSFVSVCCCSSCCLFSCCCCSLMTSLTTMRFVNWLMLYNITNKVLRLKKVLKINLNRVGFKGVKSPHDRSFNFTIITKKLADF